eukprot:3931923-Rhodomonas_salina.3
MKKLSSRWRREGEAAFMIFPPARVAHVQLTFGRHGTGLDRKVEVHTIRLDPAHREARYATCLRARYAMSGADIAYRVPTLCGTRYG